MTRKASLSMPRLKVSSSAADALSRFFTKCNVKLLGVPVFELVDQASVLFAWAALAANLVPGRFSLFGYMFTLGKARCGFRVKLLGDPG